MSDSDDSFEYELDFSYEDDAFDEEPPVLLEKQPSLDVPVPWRLSDLIKAICLDSARDLRHHQLPNCSEDELLIMLQMKRWQKDDVINAFYDDERALRRRCGLPSTGPLGHLTSPATFECPVCVESLENSPTYSLSCGHQYCGSCWGHYIHSIMSENEIIRCMDPGCEMAVPHRDAAKLLDLYSGTGTQSLEVNPLLVASVRAHVDRLKTFRWCPATDCTDIVEYLGGEWASLEEAVVKCSENHEFCFRCVRENHLPCPCDIVKRWIKKCEDDSETANWIHAHTQECPECGTIIEKNGGCNHMTCKKCKNEFCWLCMGKWLDHKIRQNNCNRFKVDKEEKKSKELKLQELHRYLHFYKRFTVHELSMKGDQKIYLLVHKRMKFYMDHESKTNNQLSWMDVQFLHDAVRALVNGRKTLKWTYVFAFYLEPTNFSEIFEQTQDYLNSCVEKLSKFFDDLNRIKDPHEAHRAILKGRSNVTSLTAKVLQRRKLMVEAAHSGLDLGHLRFKK